MRASARRALMAPGDALLMVRRGGRAVEGAGLEFQ